MAYIEGDARDQARLPPAWFENCGGGPGSVINAFVDQFDRGEAGFYRSRPKATVQDGYDPGNVLKLYLYGVFIRVRLSRRLEADATRNIGLIWLLRGLPPDYKTIADFSRNTRIACKAVFRAFAVLCRKLDLFSHRAVALRHAQEVDARHDDGSARNRCADDGDLATRKARCRAAQRGSEGAKIRASSSS